MYNPISKFQLSYKGFALVTSKIIAASMIFVVFFGNPVFAITQQEAQNELNQLNGEIGNINSTITDLKSQKNTLANELSTLDAQAQAIQLQINASQAEINVLGPQIETTNAQITKAETDMVKQKAILGEYVRQMYIDGQTSQMQLILTSNNFSDFVDKSQYLNTMQSKVKETTDKVIALRKELEDKRLDLESKKATADSLKASQLSQKQALDNQRYQKDTLISQTNGSEAAYQSMLKGKISRKGILECIASGSCNGDANGQLLVVNQGTHYYQWQAPWGYQLYEPTCSDCTFANYGCLITSLAMYHGITPPEEAARHSFTQGNGSNGGLLIGSTGQNVTGNWGTINSTLASGGSVIFGLNMGGYEHYVLAVGLSDGRYLINDPYFTPGTTYKTSRVFKAIIPY